MNGRPYTASELTQLREMYPNRPTSEVAKALTRSRSSVYHMAQIIKVKKTPEFLASEESSQLRKGQTRPGSEKNQFKKGHVPANKGTRRPGWSAGRMRETQFKKGQRSGFSLENWVPIGTILPDSDGYLRIKLREAVAGKEPTGFGNSEAWPQLHRHVWTQNKGPIPPKHIVTFKDRDRQNCAIENLELLTLADNMRRNGMWATMPRELAETMQLNGQLKRKIRSLTHGKKQDGRPEGSPVRDARESEGPRKTAGPRSSARDQ